MPKEKYLENQKPTTRYRSLADAGQKGLEGTEITSCNESIDMLRDLGIIIGEDGYPKKEEGPPRIFISGLNEENRDVDRTPREMGVKVGGRKFWEQALLGNVFVYPAGADKPSQLRVSRLPGQKGKMQVSVSKPLEPDRMPELRMPKPNFWHRMWHAINKNWYKNIVEPYDTLLRDAESRKERLSLNSQSRSSVQPKDEQQNLNDALKADDYRKKHSAQMEKYKEYTKTLSKCMGNLNRIHGLHPKPKEAWFHKGNQYSTREQFAKLKDYGKEELDLSKGNRWGVSFSEQDFATMSYWTCQKPEYLKAGAPYRASYDPDLVQKLTNLGLTRDEAQFCYNEVGSMNVTTDILSMNPPRGNDGKQTIEPIIQPAREETKKAFQEYQNGNRGPLAGLVANAVKRAAMMHASMDENKPSFGDANRGQLEICGRLGLLLEKDPQLAELAKKEHGLSDADLKLVQGLGEYKKLNDARNKAKEALAKGEMEGQIMTRERKKRLVRDIVKADLAEQTLYNDVKNHKHAPVCEEKGNRVLMEGMAGNLQTGQELPEGKIDSSICFSVGMYHLPMLYDERSKTVADLRANSKKLNEMADAVIKQDGLYSDDMTPGQLFDKTHKHVYSPKALQAAAEATAKPAVKEEPEKDLGLGKQEQNLGENTLHTEPAGPQLGAV